MNSEIQYLKPYYPQYDESKIQKLIESAKAFEIERKAFVLSLPQKEKEKTLKVAVKINGILVYKNN